METGEKCVWGREFLSLTTHAFTCEQELSFNINIIAGQVLLKTLPTESDWQRVQPLRPQLSILPKMENLGMYKVLKLSSQGAGSVSLQKPVQGDHVKDLPLVSGPEAGEKGSHFSSQPARGINPPGCFWRGRWRGVFCRNDLLIEAQSSLQKGA